MDDYMDKQTAINLLDNLVGMVEDTQENDYDTALKMGIEALKAHTQPVQRWIPCSKRLPNHDEYIKNNGLFIVSDGNRSYSEWYDIYDKRRFGEPTMSGFRSDYAVTAWMPLPEPYEDGE